MKSKTCLTKNIARLAEAGEALMDRAPGMPGMGLVSGVSGTGKTTGITWLAIKHRGVFVRAIASVCPSAMLQMILKELDVDMNGTLAAMTMRIVELLAERQRPLFIDEADYLVGQQRMMDTLRDLHDLASVPVIMIGEENIRRKLKLNERLDRRIAQHVEFGSADLQDARVLANGLCEVEVADDILAQLHKECGGDKASTGRIVLGLSQIEALARAKGKRKVTLTDWPQGGSFFDGSTATSRRRASVTAIPSRA